MVVIVVVVAALVDEDKDEGGPKRRPTAVALSPARVQMLYLGLRGRPRVFQRCEMSRG